MSAVKKLKEFDFNTGFNGLYDNEYMTFDMYFSSLCSMQVHPGAGTKEHKALSLSECKDMAVEMLKIRRELSLFSLKSNQVGV